MPSTYYKVRRGRIDEAAPTHARRASFDTEHLTVRMFNVGSGEAVVIRFPNDRVWIVDCGSGNHRLGDNRRLGQGIARYLNSNGLTLEAMIPTHPHIDHAGAFRWLLDEQPTMAPKVWFIRAEEHWDIDRVWIDELDTRLDALNIEPVVVVDSHRVFELADDITAHLIAAHGADDYTSVFLHLRYKQARLLFTGDVECDYETHLLRLFTDYDLTSDVLKVTHHGSSTGTSTGLVDRVRHGLSIASTTDDHHHLLEALERLGGLGQPRRVFETVVDGDIIVRTDGNTFGDGVLYQIDFDTPGMFAQAIGASVVPLSQLNARRTTANHSDCG
ncbi:MAG: MBL fold metallo-hydrolase [Acidobacteria bacterium]|nr:MBL fold metallo-hydrolase [Acidobacteriota bacterium]